MVYSKMKKKTEEKSRIVTWGGGLGMNREYTVREADKERERDIIRWEGEAADHRQEIAIANARIPNRGVITFLKPEMQYGETHVGSHVCYSGAKAVVAVRSLSWNE